MTSVHVEIPFLALWLWPALMSLQANSVSAGHSPQHLAVHGRNAVEFIREHWHRHRPALQTRIGIEPF